jgi:hypothetical protein
MMNEIDFRKRVYTDPAAADQEILDSAASNPDLQNILDQTQKMDEDMREIINAVDIPHGLKEQLLSISEAEQTSSTSSDTLNALAEKPAANANIFQYFAVAASLMLAVGITFSLTYSPDYSPDYTPVPSVAEIAFGNEVIDHLYHESTEIEAINSGLSLDSVGMPMIVNAMTGVGTRLVSNSLITKTPVRFAKPCNIIPAYDSAHLMIEGSQGAVSVFVINNSPVSIEYKINDERFNGIVVPMINGNMILVGEADEDLDLYKDLFSENIEWII